MKGMIILFIIGNVKDSNTANEISRTITTPNKDAKIYGVSFDPEFSTHGITFNPGVGLYDAKDLVCTPTFYYYDDDGNENITLGQDDFNIPGSPFDIKYVRTYYDISSDKQIIYSMEGDSDFKNNFLDGSRINVNGPGQLWVRFPKFYYKRPDVYTWLVSSDPLEGFSPSPMHYRNGKLYNYAYVSFDCLKSCVIREEDEAAEFYRTGSFTSCEYRPDTFQIDRDINGLASTKQYFYTYPMGFYIYDYCAHASILMLMLIKYRTFDLISFMGGNFPSDSFNISNTSFIISNDWHAAEQKFYIEQDNDVFSLKDTVIKSKINTNIGYDMINLGLMNINGTIPYMIDGLYFSKTHSEILIATDIVANATNYATDYNTLTTYPHIMKTSLNYINTSSHPIAFNGLQYNSEYPYIFMQNGTTSTSITGNIKAYYYMYNPDLAGIVLINNSTSSTYAKTGYCNPFSIHGMGFDAQYYSYRGIFFSD